MDAIFILWIIFGKIVHFLIKKTNCGKKDKMLDKNDEKEEKVVIIRDF